MPRRPTEAERALWRQAMHDVKPFDGIIPPPPPALPAPAAPPPPLPKIVAPERRASPAPALGTGLDRRSALRLKRGQMAIEARLDLHGMTQHEAHAALLRFILHAHDAGTRAVLIITGKGGGGGEGVLRRAVPLWLAAPDCRGRILAISTAQPKDGGGGALYVLLRRRRAVT